ncbi:ALF repeat-containing protein [Streptomyces sp. NPDC002917]|uniref:ALF repeat-containing protein n=1 Tax=unclassified Streptomyces TaxID=2593676 RepID=UPI002E81700C|nr:ALF repeat-containing protein [Streptomyces sp. NBC_00562]
MPVVSNAIQNGAQDLSVLRAAAEDAVDGTPEEMRYFLEHGQYEMTAQPAGGARDNRRNPPGPARGEVWAWRRWWQRLSLMRFAVRAAGRSVCT